MLLSKQISKEYGAQMSKFKVGDRVTLSGTIASVPECAEGYELYEVDTGGMHTEILDVKLLTSDTTFRDQAAIAALHGLIADSGDELALPQNIAKFAFDLAEALDVERKKRDAS